MGIGATPTVCSVAVSAQWMKRMSRAISGSVARGMFVCKTHTRKLCAVLPQDTAIETCVRKVDVMSQTDQAGDTPFLGKLDRLGEKAWTRQRQAWLSPSRHLPRGTDLLYTASMTSSSPLHSPIISATVSVSHPASDMQPPVGLPPSVHPRPPTWVRCSPSALRH